MNQVSSSVHRLLSSVAFCCLWVSLGVSEEPNDEASSKFFDAAKQFTIDADRDSLKLVPRPILNWTNPERRTSSGALFLWTGQGLPQAAMCIYPNPNSAGQVHDHEFQSLSTDLLSARADENLVWQPSTPGLEYRTLAKPAPGVNASQRLRQMRNHAREFSASIIKPNTPEKLLRLMAAPLHRYTLDDSQGDHELVDGAVFGFVQGTDPEVLLLLEVIQTTQGMQWRYALARMTMVPVRVKHSGDNVWETEWARAASPVSPYYVLKKYAAVNIASE